MFIWQLRNKKILFALNKTYIPNWKENNILLAVVENLETNIKQNIVVPKSEAQFILNYQKWNVWIHNLQGT